jgi:hypothetical protein
MIIENKWFVGLISIPLYATTFLSLSVLTTSIFAYILIGAIVLYIAGIIYHHLVVKRVLSGVKQPIAIVQWLALQLAVIGVLYVSMSIISSNT